MATKKEPVNVGEELKAAAEKQFKIWDNEDPISRHVARAGRSGFIAGAQWQSSQRDKELEEARRLLGYIKYSFDVKSETRP